MQTILLLSRGERLSALFGAIARELGKKYRIVAVHRAHRGGSVDDPRDWEGVENLISYDLDAETPARTAAELNKRAAEIESELGLSAYRSASNYLLYRRFAKEYFKTWSGFYGTEREILEEFVGAYSLISDIFDRHQPSLVFYETPDIILHRVAQTIAYRRGVFALGTAFNNLFGDGIINFTHGCNRRNPLLEYYHRHSEDISEQSWAAADALLQKLGAGELHAANYVEDHKKVIKGRRLSQRLNRLRQRLAAPMPLRDRYAQIRRTAAIYRNQRWLNAHLRRAMPSGPYVLVSLHYQPEASTCMVAPRWVDQGYVVEQAAINAPSGIRIAVKENPKGYGFRGEAYYARLRDLSNVELIHPLVSNDRLIREATAILSIAGTVGIEAIALGKKVAVLARPSYDVYDGVRKIDHPADIFDALRDPAWQPELQVDARRAFLAAVAQSVLYAGPPQVGTPWPRPEVAGPHYAHGLEQFLAFVKRTGFSVEQVPVAL